MTGRAQVTRGARLAALVLACAATLAFPPAGAPTADAAKNKRPNIVVIQIDDAPRHSVSTRTMPNVFNKIAGRGINFTNAITTTPLCCPSRMSLLTGQYAHNHRVLTNFYPRLTGKKNTLPVWLSNRGYRTAHIGKYANGYWRGRSKDTRSAPGWTDWYTSANRDAFYNYDFSINGKRRHFGKNPRAHQTRVVTRYATRVIRKHFRKRRGNGKGHRKRRTKQPLYLQADYYAPHSGAGGSGRCSDNTAVPLPGDQGAFEGAPLPEPPSFDEADVSDKPSFMQDVPSLTEESIQRLTVRYRCVLEALIGVDRGVKKILKTLKRSKAMKKTVVVFLNDNGFFFGEHRLASRLSSDQGGKFEPKVVPYEEAYRVPLFVRAPKRFRGGTSGAQTITHPVANIDLAPTFLDLARAKPCRKRNRSCRLLDGTSLVPLMRGATSSPPPDRALLVEYRGRGNLPTCKYAGLVFPQETYVVHDEVRLAEGGCVPAEDTDIEHYELDADPFQLENLFPAPLLSELETRQQQLEARLAKLRTCAGSPRGPGKTGRFRCE